MNREIKGSVIILLSTYNAEQYLREQLDSLLQQTYPEIRIVVRDDGSTDSTLSILEEYCQKAENVSYYAGENLGAKNSFFDLMKYAAAFDFEFCAFCDQDDYWKTEKIEKAVEVLQKKGRKPVLYCGRTKLVDADLKPLLNEIKRDIYPAFSNALVENIVTGCTTVLNRSMYDIIMKYLPEYCIMHDWWMYLVATCFGQVFYDDIPYILYRQHGNNVMGIDSSYKTEMKNRAKKYKSRKSNICMQAAELVRLMEKYGEEKEIPKAESCPSDIRHFEKKLSQPENVRTCYEKAVLLAHYKKGVANRFRLVFGYNVFRQRRMDDFIFRVLFLLGMR